MRVVLILVLAVSLAQLSSAMEDRNPPAPAGAENASPQPATVDASSSDAGAITAAIITPATPLLTLQPVIMPFARPPIIETRHSFFDWQNCAALVAIGGSLTGDALSTQKGLGLPGFHEVNPIARPFVQNRAGAALYSAASFAFMGGGMYLAHKSGHHKLERVLPFAVAGWEGFLTLRNYHLTSNTRNAR